MYKKQKNSDYELRITLLNDRHWDVRLRQLPSPSAPTSSGDWSPMRGKERERIPKVDYLSALTVSTISQQTHRYSANAYNKLPDLYG